MADTDVKITFSQAAAPLGLTISYGVNTIPVCLVDLDPTISNSLLENPDAAKRKVECTITGEVTTNRGLPGEKTQQIKFVGLFDGVSINQTMGSLDYKAVIKSKWQTLIEANTKTPGLHPLGQNVFKRVRALEVDGSSDEETAFKGLVHIDDDPGANIVDYYASILKGMLQIQADGGNGLFGQEGEGATNLAIKEVIQSGNYKQAAQKALDLVQGGLDVSALSGTVTKMSSAYLNQGLSIIDMFLHGPENVWENMLAFYDALGACLVVGNNKCFVVPANSFIKPQHTVPGPGQDSDKPNTAYPANYNQWSYNDNGYRGVGYVVVLNDIANTNKNLHQNVPSVDMGMFPKTAEAGGDFGTAVLIVRRNPFMFMGMGHGYNPEKGKDARTTQGKYPGKEGIKNSKSQVNVQKEYEKEADTNPIVTDRDVFDNYAEIKLYQARYGDRIGSITMEFDPNWVPGTSGTLYTRYPGIFLDFFVTNVTHKIALTPPNGGTAVTVISFSCARLGSDPVGVDEDKFFGYNQGKMQGVQQSFIGDISA